MEHILDLELLPPLNSMSISLFTRTGNKDRTVTTMMIKPMLVMMLAKIIFTEEHHLFKRRAFDNLYNESSTMILIPF